MADTKKIRNVAVVGHGQSGKTTLVEHLLFTAGTIDEAQSTASGKTVCDYTKEEIERKISMYAKLVYLSWHDALFNFWDTPGASDFLGEVILAFRSSENALMVLDGKAGVQIETIKYWRNLNERNKPRMIFVNKLDEPRSDYEACLKDARNQFGTEIFPITLPIGTGENFSGVVDILTGKAYKVEKNSEVEIPLPPEMEAAYKTARGVVAGAAAEGSDELLVKFIDEGELTDAEIAEGLKLALAQNKIVPAFAGAAEKNIGLTSLLNFIENIAAAPEGALETVLSEGGEQTIKTTETGAFSGLVVKTSNDQFSGRLSYIKVITGNLSSDTDVFNINEQKKERIGKLFKPVGKKLTEVKNLCAGDIGVAAKLSDTKTNDTLAVEQNTLPFIKLRTPSPIYSLAVTTGDKKTTDKMGELLFKFCEEDQTLSYTYNAETAQNILSGMGELQLNTVLSKLKDNSKIEIQTSTPKVAYRETIQRKAQAEYTHKKQSGGHGQYARVVLAIEPLPRGERYKFSNAVFGGAISKNYIPGVEKGVLEAMQHGVLAGFPVIDVATTVLDGKEHPVDSSELAFKIAARQSFKDAMRNAGAILLEPIMNITVLVQANYLGDIMSDLSSKRGRIIGQSSLSNGIEEIKAQAPAKELLKYAIDLKALTSGTGSFEMSFDHYEPISGKLADEIIAQAENANDDEND